VAAQGGDVAYIDDLDRLPRAVLVEVVTAPRSGYLSQVHARLIGKAALQLGAGRHRKEDAIDHAVGIHVHHKVGDHLEQGDALFTIHAGNEGQLEIARRSVVEACRWSEQAVEPLPLFYGSIIQ
ncbi:MAG: pyrimidine-nucleoside phosphorylase, partial [Chloroflexi bacterium]|nr:pyrimidine-nucleoside phosphorylase [Chloroflexota bacterium]